MLAVTTKLIVMPDSQDGDRLPIEHVPDNMIAEDCVTHGIWVGGLLDSSPQLREEFQVLDALDQFAADATCRFWIVLSDEHPQPLEIGNRLLGVDKPHLEAFGTPCSLAVPQERSQS